MIGIVNLNLVFTIILGNNLDTGTKVQSATSNDVGQNKGGTESRITWADVVKGNRRSARETCAESDVREEPA